MKQKCKCHGVSGSCSLKVCWNIQPDFRVISNELANNYKIASKLEDESSENRLKQLKQLVQRRRRRSDPSTSPSKQDYLIFIDKSPNFCRSNLKFGSTGTKERVCKVKVLNDFNNPVISHQNSKRSNSQSSCDYLCCGRGYKKRTIQIEKDCRCQFEWCCQVKCQKCKKTIIEHVCN
jgi:hypothetical protein